MDKITLISLAAVVIGFITLLYTVLYNFKASVTKDLHEMKCDMRDMFEVMNKRYTELDKRIFESNARMDGVYNVILNTMNKGDNND